MAEAKPETPETNDAAAAATDAENGGEGAPKQKREHIPKPDSTSMNAEVAEIDAEIKKLIEKQNSFRATIETQKKAREQSRTVIQEARAKLQSIRQRKDKLMAERKQMFAERDALEGKHTAMAEAGKAMRGELRFTNLEDINREIGKMTHRQETTSMSLQEEKALVKEIEELKKSKKLVERYTAHMNTARTGRDASKGIKERVGAKNKELKAVGEEILAQKAVISGIEEKYGLKTRGPNLYKDIDALRTSINEKRDKIRAIRDAFRKENDVYYTYLREVRKERDAARAAEEAKWREEKLEQQRLYEEELAKQKPWLDEIALCDFLTSYLQTNYLKEDGKKTEAAAAGPGTITLDDGTVVQARGKKYTKEDEFFAAFGGKKKKKKARKKKKDIKHSLDTLSSFELLSLTPPPNVDAVSKSLEELQKKRDYYDTLPRAATKKKKVAKKEKGSSRNAKSDSKSNASEGPVIETPYGKAVIETEGDSMVAKLPWGKLYSKVL